MNPIIVDLAARFATQLRKELGDATVEAIHKTNLERNDETCASHDYLDANEVMNHAWYQAFGENVDPRFDNEIWSAAWLLAKKHGFNAAVIRASL